MDIMTEFAHLTERAKTDQEGPRDRYKVSINIPVRDLYMVDRLAKAIDLTRQDVLNRLISGGLPDAVRGYFQIMGDDPLGHMSWEEFCEKVDEGEYFTK